MERTRRRWRAATAGVAASALAITALTACTGSHAASPQQTAAEKFLTAVGSGDAAGAAARTDQPATARPALERSLDGLGRSARARFRVTKVSDVKHRTEARFAATWSLPGTRSAWTYQGTLPLAKQNGTWRVVWRDSDLYPQLTAGTHLAVQRDQPTRAALLDSAGRPLFARTPVVRVGVEKKLVSDLPKLAGQLAAVPELESTPAEIISAVRAAGPTDFVPVITLRQPAYERIRARIHDLPGTVFQSDTLLLPPTPQFAQPLLGGVGDATKSIIDAAKGRIVAGDQTGVGGLQQAYDTTLAGTPGVAVVASADDGTAAPHRLATVAPARPGRPVKLSLDRRVQTAADAALAKVSKPAAIVAVQPSTGRILADANSSSVTYDFGLAGAFPPGSTFKMVTWTAAFTTNPALTPTTRVPCPATTTVDGRRFENENKFSHPPIPVSEAFGFSCNTSAIEQALKLPESAVGAAAGQLGVGAHWSLPVTAFSGSVPPPRSKTEWAADAIGQGRVLASPMLMALVAAAVTTGKVHVPSLAATTPAATAKSLPASLVTKMQTLMKATIEPGGTGHALAPLGGVEGKTGTAEYGTATPPRSHSWFAGTQGDLAFAVFVYDGASTNVNAVPIAGRFLQGLS